MCAKARCEIVVQSLRTPDLLNDVPLAFEILGSISRIAADLDVTGGAFLP